MNLNNLKKIFFLLENKEKKKFILILIMIIIGMIFETFGIALIIPFLGLLSNPDLFLNYPYVKIFFNSIGATSDKEIIIFTLIIFLIFYISKNIYLTLLSWKQINFSNDLLKNISSKLFKKYLFQPYTFHLQKNSSELVKNIMAETFSFGKFNIQTTLSFLSEVFVLIGISILLLILQPIATIVIIFIISLFALIYLKITKEKIKNWGSQRQQYDSKRMQNLQESLGGFKTVTLSGYEYQFLEEYDMWTKGSTDISKKINFISDIPRFIIEIIFITLFIITTLYIYINNNNLDTVIGTIGLFAMAAFRIIPATNRILYAIQNFKYGIPILETLYHDLKELKEINKPISINKLVINNNIQIKNLSFSYNKYKKAIDNVSLIIKKGSFIGFIGESGAGKSTLVDLILGLLNPSSGEILIDNVSIFNHLNSWQKSIGYVPQSIFLSDDTLKRNIAFGLSESDINTERVVQVLKESQLYEYVLTLPAGIDTKVGESGVNFSGGQRQRIGIARALYHNPEILILDEATSALDTKTEKEIIDLVNSIHGQKTVISIAHRLSTLEQCDLIYEFNNGQVVNFGKPNTILKKGN